MQDSLFKREILPATWLPDETLYSWISRFHRLSGSPHPSKTSRLLFGHARNGISHDFPCRLDILNDRTEGTLGTLNAVALQHTLTGYYRAFSNEKSRRALDELPKKAAISNAKFAAGLLTTGLRAHHPLKACDVCLMRDREQFGVGHWHLTHQYPGVWVCPEHNNLLQELPYKSNNVRRFDLLLPDAGPLRPSPLLHATKNQLQRAKTLATWIQRIVEHFRWSPVRRDRLTVSLRNAMGHRNWLSSTGRMRLTSAARDLARTNAGFAKLPENEAFPSNSDSAQAALTRLMGRPDGGAHPLRWLALVMWLFESPDKFIVSIDHEISPSPEPPAATSGQNAIDVDMQKLFTLVKDGMSVRMAAKNTRLGINTALVALSANGIETRRRPKKAFATVEAKLLALARHGMSREELSRATALSITTVGRLLRANPTIEVQRVNAALEQERNKRRREWKGHQRRNSTLTIKQRRLEKSSTYTWLYRNDREWLDQQLNSAPKHTRGDCQNRLNWKSRDESTVVLIEQAAVAASEQHKKLTLPLLRILEPDIVPRLSQMKRLPQAQRALERALRSK